MGVNKDDYIITYEDALNKRFGASTRTWYLLKLFGHKNVSVLNGGFDAWKKEGYAVDNEKLESVKVADPLGNFKVNWDSSEWLSK